MTIYEQKGAGFHYLYTYHVHTHIVNSSIEPFLYHPSWVNKEEGGEEGLANELKRSPVK